MNEDIVNGKQKKCPLLNIFPLKGNSSQFYEVFHMKNWFLAKIHVFFPQNSDLRWEYFLQLAGIKIEHGSPVN